jgi:hypothetical protein
MERIVARDPRTRGGDDPHLLAPLPPFGLDPFMQFDKLLDRR